jgi:hypothetical protein
VAKDGYIPYLVGDVTDETFRASTWPMLSDELLGDWSATNLIPYPWENGAIALTAFPRMAGATFDLVGATATAYYDDEAGTPTLGLTATASSGDGGFIEVPVPPGEYQVEFGGTATNCVPSIAWPGDAANRIKVPVRAGYFSYGFMTCDAP